MKPPDVTEQERPDQEPATAGAPGPSIAIKGRRALARVHREIGDNDLANPAVGRMLIDEVERLETEVERLSEFRERAFAAEKEVGLLGERAKRSLGGEIVFGGCFALAGVAFGYAPTAWADPPNGALALVFGVVLVILGIAARYVQR